MSRIASCGIAALLMGLSGAASARPSLVHATPADNSILHPGHIAISLTFSEDLEPIRTRLTLVGPTGAPILLMAVPAADGRTVTSSFDAIPGNYDIGWHVADLKNHIVRGDIHISVAP